MSHNVISHEAISQAGQPAISVRNLSVRYRQSTALSDVSFDIQPGHLCGLVGMNGAGKSTLFKALMGVVRPSTGEIELEGLTVRQALKRGIISYVPQQEDIDWNFPLSVADVVMMGRYGSQGLMRTPRAKDREAVQAALNLVELEDLARRQIGELSGGQRKRAFVARGLAQEATIMLLDEPFAGVDKRSERMIIDVLRTLAASGVTILVASHDLHSLPSLCDEAILLNRRLIAHDSIESVLQPEQLAKAFDLDEDQAEIVGEMVQ